MGASNSKARELTPHPWLSSLCILNLLLFLQGCASPSLKKEQQLASLLEAYQTKNAQLYARRQQRLSYGIRDLQVVKADPPYYFRVSVDLSNAALSVVVRRVLDVTGIPYVFDDAVLTGTATARFQNVPLQQALNLILNARGLAAVWNDRVLVIRNTTTASAMRSPSTELQGAAAMAAPAPPVLMHLELPMQYLDMETVGKFLSGLYPTDDDNGPLLSYGLQTHTNTVFLRGSGENVTQAATLLRAADHDPAHVVIEALVVQFRALEIQQLGIDITNLTAGNLSNVVTNFGSLSAPAAALTFTRGAINITELSALIQALIAQNYARLVARPYVSTLSGKEATVDITRNQFIVVNRPEEGASITALEPIKAGVTLKITPTIMPRDMIRIVIDVEDSQFVATNASTPGTVTTEVDRSVATTVMQVENGETIIIGGLARHQVSRGNAGVPWLRRVPPFSLLFGNQAEMAIHDEVVIYVTPYIWEPGLESPLPAAGTFTVPEKQGGPSRLERLGLPSSSGHP